MSKKASDIRIICLESEALDHLIDELAARIKAAHNLEIDNWIDEHEAMKLLRISSKTTLQKFRDERRIGFSAISRKVIVYDRNSIVDYIEKNSKKALQ